MGKIAISNISAREILDCRGEREAIELCDRNADYEFEAIDGKNISLPVALIQPSRDGMPSS
jgi:hypothetical protein